MRPNEITPNEMVSEWQALKLKADELASDVRQGLVDYIEGYVDEGIVISPSTVLINFECRGIVFSFYSWSDIDRIKPDGCPSGIKTDEDALKHFRDVKHATRCARQAYMAFKFIIGK